MKDFLHETIPDWSCSNSCGKPLFLSFFKNFSTVMTELLDDAFRDGALQQPSEADEMAINLEDTSAMELDKENAKPEKSQMESSDDSDEELESDSDDETIITLVTLALHEHHQKYYNRIPCRTSILRGHDYVLEVLNGHDARCDEVPLLRFCCYGYVAITNGLLYLLFWSFIASAIPAVLYASGIGEAAAKVFVVVADIQEELGLKEVASVAGPDHRAISKKCDVTVEKQNAFLCLLMFGFRLEGKVAIITGAASGIGEAAAKLFVENGAFVVVADIQEELGLTVVASIAGPDVDRAIYKKCDVTVEKQVEETVAFAIEKYGTLDIMYSNAGVLARPLDSILDMDMEEGFDRNVAVDLRGSALCIKHAARAMVKRQVRGSIICTASSASILGGFGPPGYTAAKHGLVGLVRAAAGELGKHGIRVNCVSPYYIPTPLGISALLALGIDTASEIEAVASSAANLKGVGLKAKDIAEAALFLASDESSVYVSGHNLAVDGGFTVIDHSFTMSASQVLMKEKQY
ncbi:hypothetical protein RHMOL_Rhmol06G0245000 [Rhododendron molle]|uniref:Uncharacterized protein n=1 Tax=Rhododendron molle TaxID=49168 RepID=A0ACC0NFQ3_RHOML|nr:hypothetical protein RHMOL_Rhmol06G0245000 [Rhododendron molle]